MGKKAGEMWAKIDTDTKELFEKKVRDAKEEYEEEYKEWFEGGGEDALKARRKERSQGGTEDALKAQRKERKAGSGRKKKSKKKAVASSSVMSAGLYQEEAFGIGK